MFGADTKAHEQKKLKRTANSLTECVFQIAQLNRVITTTKQIHFSHRKRMGGDVDLNLDLIFLRQPTETLLFTNIKFIIGTHHLLI